MLCRRRRLWSNRRARDDTGHRQLPGELESTFQNLVPIIAKSRVVIILTILFQSATNTAHIITNGSDPDPASDSCTSPCVFSQRRYLSGQQAPRPQGFIGKLIDNIKQEYEKNKEMKESLEKFKQEAEKLEQSEALKKAR